MTMSANTLLISGSSGYLGGVAARACKNQGFEVLATSGRGGNTPNASINIDIHANGVTSLAKQIEGHRCRAVLHFATEFSRSTSGNSAESIVSANLQFAIKLAEAAKMAGVPHFINISSTWEKTRSVLRGVEVLLTPYASSKRAFRAYLDERFGDSGYVKNLFLEETIGPTDHRDKVVPNLIRSALAAEPYVVREPNLGLNFALAESLASYLIEDGNWITMAYESGYVSYPKVTVGMVAELIRSMGQLDPILQISEAEEKGLPRVSLFELEMPIIRDFQAPPLPTVLRRMVDNLAKD